MGLDESRVEFDGLLVALDRLVELPPSPQGAAEARVGVRVFRIDGDGLAVFGDSLV